MGLEFWNRFVRDCWEPGEGGSGVTSSGIGDMVQAHHADTSLMTWSVPVWVKLLVRCGGIVGCEKWAV